MIFKLFKNKIDLFLEWKSKALSLYSLRLSCTQIRQSITVIDGF